MNYYKSLLETTENTRDLGGYVCHDGTVTRRMSLIRSDVQKHPSERDIAFLLENKITTVIDMRTSEQRAKAPSGFEGIEGLSYHHCPVEDEAGSPRSGETDIPAGYLKIAESDGAALVFRTIAEAPYGVIFNCVAGKDRSGVISAVLLLLADVSEKDVVTDYILTREYGVGRLRAIKEKYPDADMDRIIPNAENMGGFIDFLMRKYGNARNFLLSRGLSWDETELIRNKLVSKRFPTHIVAVDGVVERDGKILIVKNRVKDYYSVPGGQVETGENLIEALKREFLEETGIEVTPTKLISVSSTTSSRPGYNGYETIPTIVTFGFACKYVGGVERTSNETSEVLWVDKDSVLDYIKGIPLEARMRVYLENTPSVRYFQYDTYPERVMRLTEDIT